MGIKSDLEEFGELWNRGSWGLRGVAVLFFFLQLGSLASLSDTFFEFRGFMRDGIEFYEDWIRDPLKTFLFLIFGFQLGSSAASSVIYLMLLGGSVIRVHIATKRFDFTTICVTVMMMGTFWIPLISLADILFDKHELIGRPPQQTDVLGMGAFYLFAGFCHGIIVENKKMYYASVLAPLLLVGVLGAASNAMHRPL